MKIGIIADTHIKKDIDKFINSIDIYFKEVDLLIHAGDYINNQVLKALKNYKNFVGVWGNVDDDNTKELINEKEIILIEGYKIGIFHGHGSNRTTLDRAYDKFIDDQVDIIIFGHSHQPLAKTKNGVLMLNPGSITNKRRERWFSFIILEINEEGIDVKFKFLNYM